MMLSIFTQDFFDLYKFKIEICDSLKDRIYINEFDYVISSNSVV